MDKPIVISTFAGCGGSSLGYHLAGFKEMLAVEWDDNAVQTFKLNFPDVPVYHGDIAKLTGAECMRLAGIGVGELDVFDGSPPCQGFSTAGKRKFDDPRNSLFKEYARLIQELQPKVFVMENVTGMVKGYMKQAYLEIMRTLRGCGYRAKGEVMNAMYYNVPQSRERVIVIGVREDLGVEPSHPKPQTRPKTFKDAMRGLPDNVEKPLTQDMLRYAPYHDGTWNTDEKLYRKLNGRSGGTLNCKWCSWDRVVGTIPKMETSVAGHVHPNKKRFLNIAELVRAGSFPDNFQFIGKRSDIIQRIGNSVPPNLMRAIAEHIRVNILDKIEASNA